MQPGDKISERYRLLRLIDVGGMGEVWAAQNELTRRHFAIKFLLPTLAERPDALARFIREAQTAGGLEHPAIVDVYDVAQTDEGRPYIVMELLAGESLDARLDRDGTLSSFRTAALVSQVAEGLALAHEAGIVHRDLSTANVFLARNREGGEPIPKILDFGVSKTMGPQSDGWQTADGAVLGCPEYMSPEQARGAEGVDERTDIWSLGVVMYQCLTGTVPFREKNYNALMLAILTRPHRPVLDVAPSTDPELASVVEGCLEKKREARLQSAQHLSQKLASVARRLAAGSAQTGGMTPRRRATDRLPSPMGQARQPLPPKTLPRIARWKRSTLQFGRRHGLVGVVCALLGGLLGSLLVLGLVATDDLRVSEKRQPSAPRAARLEPLPPPGAEPRRARTPRAQRDDAVGPAASPDDHEATDLALAVSRSLGVSGKREPARATEREH